MPIANTTIRIKKSVVSGNIPSTLANGEIAINSADGKLYYATPSGSIAHLTNSQSFATINANSSLILATSPTDTLSIAAGNNISITTNTTTKTVTINYTDSGGITVDAFARTTANAAFDKANSANILAQSSYNFSNTVNVFTQSAYSTANSAQSNTVITQGVDATQNTWISSNASFTQSAFTQANTANNTANIAATNITVLQSVNTVQNTTIGAAFDKANSANILAQSAYSSSNTVNVYAFSAYSTSNSAQSNTIALQGISTTQNTWISSNATFTQSAYNQANTANNTANIATTNITVLQSINLVQNTTIGAAFDKANSANILAQSAFNQANTANTRAYSTVLKTGDTMTGQLTISNTNISTNITTGALIVSGGVGIAGNTWSSGKLSIGNSLSHVNLGNVLNTAATSGVSTYRAINLIDTVAAVKIARLGGNPSIELQEWDSNIANLTSYWEMVSAANSIFQIRERSTGTSKAYLSIFQANGSVYLLSNTISTNTSTGSLILGGGLGANGNIYATAVYSNNALVLTSEPIGQGAFTFANTVNTYAYSANTFLQANDATTLASARTYANTTNTAMKAYVDQANTGMASYVLSSNNAVTAYVTAANTAMKAYVDQANTGMASYVVASNTAMKAYVDQANTGLKSYVDQANTGMASYVLSSNNAVTAYVTAANTAMKAYVDQANTGLKSYTDATHYAKTGGTISGSVSITTDLTVSGNLFVNGTTTTINTSSIVVNDPLIFLGNNNTISDTVDIGIIGHYNATQNAHTGIFRDANLKEWIFFQNYTPEIRANNLINISDPSFATSNVIASNFKGNLIGNTATVNGIELGSYSQAAFSKANTAASNTVVLQGISTTQNTWISSNAAFTQAAFTQANSANILAQSAYTFANTVNVFTQSAYSKANTSLANNGTVITVNGSSQLVIANTLPSTSNVTGALVVSGGVGIGGNVNVTGTVTTSSPVVISANSTTDALRITQVGTGNALIVEDEANPDSTPFVITSAGNLGLGVTPSAWGTTFKIAQVGTGSIFATTTNNNVSFGSNIYVDSAVAVRYISTAAATRYLQLNGTHRFYSAPSGTAGDVATLTETVIINASGNVGIGTTSPAGKLDVNGSARLGNFDINITTANSAVWIDGSDFGLGTFYGNALKILTSNTERGRVSGAGVWSLGAAPGSESLRVTPVTSAVNYVEAIGAITTQPPTLRASGSDTNIPLWISSKGTSTLNFYTNTFSTLQFSISNTASAVNYLQATGSATGIWSILSAQGSDTNTGIVLRTKGSAGVSFQNGSSASQFYVADTASAVDYIQATGSSAGFPNFSAQGTSANITIVYGSKGTGGHNFTTNGTSTNQFVIAHTASAVNYLQVTGGVTGATPELRSSGTNIPVGITGSNTWAGFSNAAAAIGVTTDVTNASGGHVVIGSITGNAPYIGSSNHSTSGNSGLRVMTAGTTQLHVTHTASAVNYMQITGAVTGANPYIYANGSDSTTSMDLVVKGAGAYTFFADSGTSRQFQVARTASAVNYFQVTGGDGSTTSPRMQAAGSSADVTLQFLSKGTGELQFFTNSGTRQFNIAHTASAVNYLTMTGSATGNRTAFSAQGSDTNVGINYNAKGAEYHVFTTSGGVAQFVIQPTASAVNHMYLTGGTTGNAPAFSAQGTDTNIAIAYAAKGTGAHVFTGQSGANQFIVASTASSVNYLQVTGAVTTGTPYILSTGSDANVNFIASTKGTGSHYFQTSTTAFIQFSVGHTASAVNYLQAKGSATGSSLTISALGSDTNIDIQLAPKGTGGVAIGATSASGYKLYVNGSFAAITKSFVIDHPTKPNMKLRYGSLEGPENGVYIRGKLEGDTIQLPEYWTKLVDPDSITVNLTPIGSHQKLYVKDIVDNKVMIGNENLIGKGIKCFYIIFAERNDVEKLQVEIG